MEHVPSSGEYWRDREKQRLFIDMKTYLVNYGLSEEHIDDETHLPTGMRVYGIESALALNEVWENDLEVADASYLSYTPARADTHGQRLPETLYLAIHSRLMQSRQRMYQDYRVLLAGGKVTGEHTFNELAPEGASLAEQLDLAVDASRDDMHTQDFIFLRDVFDKLRYQRGITL